MAEPVTLTYVKVYTAFFIINGKVSYVKRFFRTAALVLALALIAVMPALANAQAMPPTRMNTSGAHATGVLTHTAPQNAEETLSPQAESEWRRLSGQNRYETMSAIVREEFHDAKRCVIATGQNFPDALAASALAGAMGSPVILTTPERLSDEARYLLLDLGIEQAIIMGGPVAVSEYTQAEIEQLGIKCGRVEGADRYETSLNTMRVTRDAGSVSNVVIIATGRNYPDTLSIGPWAYATGSPIVLVNEYGLLTDSAVKRIRDDSHVKHVVIVGGPSVVSEYVEQQLGSRYTYERLYGADRYLTSAEIARWEVERGFIWTNVSLTTGLNYPDALVASALCGWHASPILLSDANDSPTMKLLYAKRNYATSGYLLGGPAAVATNDPIETFRPLCQTLDGIDISGWDEGIDLSNVEADFVIIKTTEGLQYSQDGVLYNPWYEDWADEVLSQGKLLGFYHYANGKDPVQEADEFYESIKEYKGRAIACLDWEGDGNEAFDTGVDPEWCKLFLDRIKDRFGGTPLLYTSKDYANKYDWSEVASKYPLWGAEYADFEEMPGYDGEPWTSDKEWGAWGVRPLIFQYSSMGVLERNGGIEHFDINLFYGTRADWQRYLK